MQPTRYIVVDLNILEDSHIFKECVRVHDQVVVVNALLGDIAGSDRKRFDRYCREFPQWYERRGAQIWIPKAWQSIVVAESSPQSKTVGLAWLNESMSHTTRTRAISTPEEFQRSTLGIKDSAEFETHERQRESFWSICDRFAGFLKTHFPSEVDRWSSNLNNESLSVFVRNPMLGWVWASKMAFSRDDFPDPEVRKILGEIRTLSSWRNALECFPDVKAIGRMSRIWCWYGMILAAGATKKFENNFEDAGYGFAASYTKYLATKDKGLRRMVRNLFPQVTLLPSDEAATC